MCLKVLDLFEKIAIVSFMVIMFLSIIVSFA